jgi:hypothetical protein
MGTPADPALLYRLMQLSQQQVGPQPGAGAAPQPPELDPSTGLPAQPSLGALAAQSGRPGLGGTVEVKSAPPTPTAKVVWNKDGSMWRYPASNAWHPKSEQPQQ